MAVVVTVALAVTVLPAAETDPNPPVDYIDQPLLNTYGEPKSFAPKQLFEDGPVDLPDPGPPRLPPIDPQGGRAPVSGADAIIGAGGSFMIGGGGGGRVDPVTETDRRLRRLIRRLDN